MRTLARVIPLLLTLALTGCTLTVHEREADPAEISLPVPAIAPDAWPARIPVVSGLKRDSIISSGARPRGLILRIDGPLQSLRQREESSRQVTQEFEADGALLIQRLRAEARFPYSVTSESAGAYLYTTTPPSEASEITTPRSRRATFFMKFISAELEPTPPDAVMLPTREDSRPTPRPSSTLRIQRTWLAFYDPATDWKQANPNTPARGMAVLVPGMFGSPRGVVDDIVQSLRDQGWCVVRMLAHPSRFTERANFAIDPDYIEGSAKSIGTVLQDRAAEVAYAAHAATAFVLEQRPEFKSLPRVAIGLSGGAMVLPTMVAYQPNAYAGAVLIAGGGNFLRVAMESNYADWIDALRFQWTVPNPTSEQLDQLDRAYLASAPLDSLFTAAQLRNKPVLVIHAKSDRAVPAHLGEELWQRLGRPERWTFDAGHEWLFLSLPFHIERLTSWIDAYMPRPATPTP
jgi:predicted esterase